MLLENMSVEAIFEKIKSGEITLFQFEQYIEEKYHNGYYAGYDEGQQYV